MQMPGVAEVFFLLWFVYFLQCLLSNRIKKRFNSLRIMNSALSYCLRTHEAGLYLLIF